MIKNRKKYCFKYSFPFIKKNRKIIKKILTSNKKGNIFSLKEKSVSNWLKSLNINVIENSRNIIYPKELDIYLPDYNIAIEFNGLYWHSELFKDKNYHLDKTLRCKENGIDLIHIFENEWENKKDIIKSIILKKINKFKSFIDLSKCVFKKINTKKIKEFITENSLFEYEKCRYKCGIFNNNELIFVIGFNKNKNNIYIINICRKKFYNITDIKYIFNVLKNIYNVDNIFLNINLRFNNYIYSDCNVDMHIKPKFWYYNKNKKEFKLNNQNYFKNNLSNKLKKYDSSLSNKDNIRKNGYIKIWDCGYLRLKF